VSFVYKEIFKSVVFLQIFYIFSVKGIKNFSLGVIGVIWGGVIGGRIEGVGGNLGGMGGRKEGVVSLSSSWWSRSM
jgi:hypothetical protein